MAKLTEERINDIRRLYKSYQNYSKVAKELGCSASTVKKYTSMEYEVELPSINLFIGGPAEIGSINYPKSDEEFIEWSKYTEEEYKELIELWKEIY